MKRWITGILALLMATVFTACGNSGAETPDTKDPADIARDIATAEVLGDTLEKIAATKSGIIKPGCDAGRDSP